MVRNIHERMINAPLAEAGHLIDRLGSREDELWPRDEWPPVRFDRPLAVGAKGGHAAVRYAVEEYVPGRLVRFRFLEPRGFIGTHSFDAEEIAPQQVRLRHTLEMRVKGAARVTWPIIFRPLHDALIEDAFDHAEIFLTGKIYGRKRAWTWRVRFLRLLFIFLESKTKTRAHSETRSGFIKSGDLR